MLTLDPALPDIGFSQRELTATLRGDKKKKRSRRAKEGKLKKINEIKLKTHYHKAFDLYNDALI